MHRFLHQRAYVELGDAALIRLGDRLRALAIVACGLGPGVTGAGGDRSLVF